MTMTYLTRPFPRITPISRAPLALGAVAALLLGSGCTQTGQGKNPAAGDPINTALSQAADRAAHYGQSGENLALLERMYKRNPEDAKTAVKFAAALRKGGRMELARAVLQPFLETDVTTPDIRNEFAKLELEQGNYASAIDHAEKALAIDAESHQAYHVKGVALDAQGHHERAEAALRQALERWEGNPVSIINNLALNLAAQGKLDEALSLIKKAKSIAPGRQDIEKNLRILSALDQKVSYRVPPLKPGRKPQHGNGEGEGAI